MSGVSPAKLRVLLLVVTAAVFAPSLGGGFVWDDVLLIRDNAHIGDAGRALTEDFWDTSEINVRQSGYFRPVVRLAFWLEWRLFGPTPWAFHLVNLLLHLVCVWLALRWSEDRLGGSSPLPALLGVLPFALHPSRVEAVAWISGATDLWMALLVLLGHAVWRRGASTRSALGAGALFGLAALAKESAILVPALLALELWAGVPPLRRARPVRDAVVTSALLVGVMLTRFAWVPPPPRAVLEHGVLDVALRVLTTVGLYVRQLVWPWPSTVMPGLIPGDGAGALHYPPALVLVGALSTALVVGLAVLAFRRRRGPAAPLLADVGWAVVPLLPVLNLVPLQYASLTADRFLYLPLLGVGAALARGLRFTAAGSPAAKRWGLAGVAALSLAWCATSASHVGHFWSDRELWRHEHAVHPDSRYVNEMLVTTLWQEGELDEALRLTREQLDLAKNDDQRLESMARYASLRVDTLPDAAQAELAELRDFFDAIAAGHPRAHLTVDGARLEAAVRPEARARLERRRSFGVQRAVLHSRTGQLPHAEALFEARLEQFPDRASSWANLARCRALQGRFQQATALLDEALARFPSDPGLTATKRQVEKAAAHSLDEPLGRARVARAGRSGPGTSRARRAA